MAALFTALMIMSAMVVSLMSVVMPVADGELVGAGGEFVGAGPFKGILGLEELRVDLDGAIEAEAADVDDLVATALMPRSRFSRASSPAGVTRSALLSKMTSAKAICLSASGELSR
jgi:hypothetical protein